MKCVGSRGNTFAAIFDNEEQVNLINQRLKEDGYEVEPPQQAHEYTFYVEAPGGFTVEILC